MDVTVAEVFGPTLQGEGPTQGRAAMFVRLGLCNLDCGWCDTPYTWDWSGKNGVAYDREAELRRVPVAELAEAVRRGAGPVRRLVVTGGEPLVQQRAVVSLVEALAGWAVEVETNGTIAPPGQLVEAGVAFNVSPKLPGSGVALARRYRADVLAQFVRLPTAAFKYVVTGAWDLSAAQQQVERLGVPPERVWLMPEGTTAPAILAQLPQVFRVAAQLGWNVSPRLHVLAFDNERGV